MKKLIMILAILSSLTACEKSDYIGEIDFKGTDLNLDICLSPTVENGFVNDTTQNPMTLKRIIIEE